MSDYIIRSKRRRKGTLIAQAVDPCLGYYIPLPADSPTQTENLNVAHASRKEIKAVDVGRWIAPNELDPGVQKYHCAADETFNSEQADEEPRSDPYLNNEGLDESKRGPTPVSSSLEYADAEWSTFVPVVTPSKKLYCRTPPRSQEALTVEAFLKRSNGQKYTGKRHADRKRLRTKRIPVSDTVNIAGQYSAEDDEQQENVVKQRPKILKRAIILSDSASEKEHETETSSISLCPSSPFPRAKDNRSKVKKSLKERIYEAAISAYGDPDPGFVLPETEDGPADGSTRLPLRFVPGPGTAPTKRTRINKKKNWCLVDPRKSKAIRTATFSSRIRPPHLAFNVEPLQQGAANDAKWTTLGAPSIKMVDRRFSEKKILNETSATKTSSALAPRSITCPPLTFVSLHEAEDSYAALLSGKGTQVNQKAKIDSPSTLLMAPRGENIPRLIPLEDNPILIKQPIPLKRHLEALGTAQPKVRPDKGVSAHAVDLQPFLDSLETSISSPIRSSTSSPSAPISDESNTIVSNKLPPQQKSDKKKTLKPLDSFMDEIIETIRKVTRIESTRQPCPNTDTPRNEGHPESFERRSLRHAMFGRKQGGRGFGMLLSV